MSLQKQYLKHELLELLAFSAEHGSLLRSANGLEGAWSAVYWLTAHSVNLDASWNGPIQG